MMNSQVQGALRIDRLVFAQRGAGVRVFVVGVASLSAA